LTCPAILVYCPHAGERPATTIERRKDNEKFGLSDRQIRKQGYAHYYQCGAEVLEFPTGRGKPRYILRTIYSTAIVVPDRIIEEGSYYDAYEFAKKKRNEDALEILLNIAEDKEYQ
jgi:hypothetical protein